MAYFEEDVPDLLETFFDFIRDDGKEHPIIVCKICCLEAPAASTRSVVCEMCFDDDFWDWNRDNASRKK